MVTGQSHTLILNVDLSHAAMGGTVDHSIRGRGCKPCKSTSQELIPHVKQFIVTQIQYTSLPDITHTHITLFEMKEKQTGSDM